ncbi:MAG: hypothetical protein PHV34_19020 [Verrucomicrobiae bacterium]|nr:hypothetical protein [Verrucomicrobiae bacterium]
MKTIQLIRNVSGNNILLAPGPEPVANQEHSIVRGKKGAWKSLNGSSGRFLLNSRLNYFYSDEKVNVDGFPLAGSLQDTDSFWGSAKMSVFDISTRGIQAGFTVIPLSAGSKFTFA